MAKFPALMLWTDAWVADTCHLHHHQRGVYLDLLVLMWRTPGCRVPDEDGWLARHLRMTPEEVQNELRPIIQEFCDNLDGFYLSQKRLTKEFLQVQKTKKAQRGRANSRWGNKKASCGENKSGNASTTTPTSISTTTSRSPFKKKERKTLVVPSALVLISDSDSPSTSGSEKQESGDAAFERFWRAYPRRENKGGARKAFGTAVKKVGVEPVLAGLARALVGWKRKELRYVPHAASWLNGERWTDEAVKDDDPYTHGGWGNPIV